mgnify:CR=1 FL=1
MKLQYGLSGEYLLDEICRNNNNYILLAQGYLGSCLYQSVPTPPPTHRTRCRLQQPQKSVRLKGCSRDSVHATALRTPQPWQSTIGSKEIAEVLITESGVQTELKMYIIYFNDSIINCSLLVDKYGTFTRKTWSKSVISGCF